MTRKEKQGSRARALAAGAGLLGLLAAFGADARAGDPPNRGTVTQQRGTNTRTMEGEIVTDDFDKLVIAEDQRGGSANQTVPRPEVAAFTYDALGEAYENAVTAFERENAPDACLAQLAAAEKSVIDSRVRNRLLALQHVYYLRARAHVELALRATTPAERAAAYGEATKALDELFKQRKPAPYFDAKLLQQQILAATKPQDAARGWRALVADFQDKVKEAPWAERYVMGARVDEAAAQLDEAVRAPNNNTKANEILAAVDALQKDAKWAEFATGEEIGKATKIRLEAFRYLKRDADLQQELGVAIRQAQLDGATADLTDYYLMRADGAFAQALAVGLDKPEAKTPATVAFMDYLRVHTLYGDELAERASEIALRLGELYLGLKGPDWFDRAQELADAARRGAATRAAADALLQRIQEQAPKAAEPAAATTPATPATK